jgi:hypothetical protein
MVPLSASVSGVVRVYVSKIGFQRADGFPPTTYVFLSSQHLPSASPQPDGCMLASTALSCSHPITTWGQLIVPAAGLRLVVLCGTLGVFPLVFLSASSNTLHQPLSRRPVGGQALLALHLFLEAVHQFRCLRSGFGYSDRLIDGKRHDYTLRLAKGTCISILLGFVPK